MEHYETLSEYLVGRPIGRNRGSKAGPCSLCGIWRQSLHRDHIIPRWRGGSDALSNLQLLCANCHQDKTIRDLRGIPRENVKRNPEIWAARNQKISVALKGKKRGPVSTAHRAAMTAGQRAYWAQFTAEQRKEILGKRPNNNAGRHWKLSEEARCNIAAAVKRRADANRALYGCALSPETRQKMSVSHRLLHAAMRSVKANG